MSLYLHFPVDAAPPYQAVVWFPGSEALYMPDSTHSRDWELAGFFVRTGRVLVVPVYAGMYERRPRATPFPTLDWFDSAEARERRIRWSQDVSRAVDYLVEREDIDRDKLAFAGWSLGAVLAPLFFTFEGRFGVALLWAGGFTPLPNDASLWVALVRRMRAPTLMLNGRYDGLFTVEGHQKPMLDLLGTPEADKRLVIYDVGHDDLPFHSELIRENLAWLDRYLGPVQRLESSREAGH